MEEDYSSSIECNSRSVGTYDVSNLNNNVSTVIHLAGYMAMAKKRPPTPPPKKKKKI